MKEILKLFAQWCRTYKMQAKRVHATKDVVIIRVGAIKYALLPLTGDNIVYEHLGLKISPRQRKVARQHNVDAWIFLWGSRFCYTDFMDEDTPSFKPFINMGELRAKAKFSLPALGVHGPYELMNAVGCYSDWCKRANFLQIKTLATVEHHTLGGSLAFQSACDKHDIKPIHGYSLRVDYGDAGTHAIKLYAVNKKGWRNLLGLNKLINVDGMEAVPFFTLISQYNEGLMAVVSVLTPLSLQLIQSLNTNFTAAFYQLDCTTFVDEEYDFNRLNAIQNYLNTYSDKLKPIAISDAYYILAKTGHVKSVLNTLGGIPFQHTSHQQYLKHTDDYAREFFELFDEGDLDFAKQIFKQAVQSVRIIERTCDFRIETGVLHLPEYVLSPEEQEHYGSAKEMFYANLDDKLQTLGLHEDERYKARLATECELIERGGFIDYFLILEDIIEWCKSQNILTGVGRGSAGGCLVAYVLGITKVDPIKYDLLFERFLNEARIKSSLPDIDTDFPGASRDRVKAYMEERYGAHYVCSVGTYQTLQLKAAVQEMGRYYGVHAKDRSYITAMLDFKAGDWENPSDFDLLFINSINKPRMARFIEEQPRLVEDVDHILKQPKSTGVHACATLIVPAFDGQDKVDIFDWIPMRRLENGMLVSEWEGSYVEQAGFLKEDILGIRQLDKFTKIFELIKKNHGVEMQLEDIPLDDPNVFVRFQNGLSEDTFHFGSQGLTAYAQQVLPESIEDMIAMLALYRPGVIMSQGHTKYVELKHGRAQPEYDYMLEGVTKNTYGLYVYQEQIMQAVQVLGGFTLTEADGVRKAMGKKIKSKMDGYKAQFLKHAVEENNCPEKEANAIWDKLEVFSGYGFNRSHAAAYAITGYYAQWMKVHYPLEFWVTAFEYANDDSDIARYIVEIHRTSDISIAPPEINRSDDQFKAEKDRIFWSLTRVRQIGTAVATAIVEEREANGNFYSVQEFVDRIPKKKVNKRCMENLVLSGAFDEVAMIKRPSDRGDLLVDFYLKNGYEKSISTIDALLGFERTNDNDYVWILKQRELSGLGYIDFISVIRSNPFTKKHLSYYCSGEDFFNNDSKLNNRVCVAGVITEVQEKRSRNGKYGVLTLAHNNLLLPIVLWNDNWEPQKKAIKSGKGSILIITGTLKFDTFRGQRTVHSDKLTQIAVA